MMVFNGTIYSKAIGGNTCVHVAAPDGIKKGDAPRRVIYLLHGLTGSSVDWTVRTRVALYADEHDVVFIMPEVGNTWYRNIPNRGRFFDYVAEELPEVMGGLFNISARREDVAAMGCSMGGYGAMKAALLYPENYFLVCSFSTACAQLGAHMDRIRRNPDELENTHLKSVYGPQLAYEEDEELALLARRAAKNPVKPIIYMNIGRQDFLYASNIALHEEMKTLDLDYTFEVADGAHEWYFWDRSLKAVLEKYYPAPPRM